MDCITLLLKIQQLVKRLRPYITQHHYKYIVKYLKGTTLQLLVEIKSLFSQSLK